MDLAHELPPYRACQWSRASLGAGRDLRRQPGDGAVRPAQAAPGPHLRPHLHQAQRGPSPAMSEDRFQLLRLLEAILFAAGEPQPEKALAARLPEGSDIAGLLQELTGLYANRGVHLMQLGERWAFRTAPDLADRLQIETIVPRKLSRPATETLAIVAYHQPVTRA